MMRRVCGALAAAAMLVVVAACGGSSSSGSSSASTAGKSGKCTNTGPGVEKTTVNVGMIVDLTGPAAPNQVPYSKGAQAYFNYANAHGGICGKQVRLSQFDDQIQVPKDVQAFKKFTIQDPVYALMGPNFSSAQDVLAGQVRKGDVPSVGTLSSESPMLSPFNKNFYSLYESFAVDARVAVQFGKTKVNGPMKAVCFAIPTGAAADFCNPVKQHVQQAGGQFLKEYQLPLTSVDATPEAQDIRSKGANVIYLIGSPTTAIALMKAMGKLGMSGIPIVSNGQAAAAVTFETSPQNIAKNFYGVSGFSPGYVPGPGNAQMISIAKQQGVSAKYYNDINFVIGWVGAKVLVQGGQAGAKAKGQVSRDTLRSGLDSISALDTHGQSGTISYSPTNHEGLKSARPYKFDFAKKQLVPIGSFSQFAG